MKKLLWAVTPLLTLGCATGSATAKDIWPLSPSCEKALALSAGPVYLREKAGVYVLGAKGYESVKASENGFVCMIERSSNDALIPQCFDEPGQQAHVKVLLDEGRKIRKGVPWPVIKADRKTGFENGTYAPAARPGVVYMASQYNLNVSVDGTRRTHIAPHVMFHAPYLSMADIGADMQGALSNRGMPIIPRGEGPLSFMVSFVERGTDSTEVNANCAGQLPDLDTFTTFPPKLP